MKRLLIALVMLASVQQASALDVAAYERATNSGVAEANSLNSIYLTGVGQGLVAANAYLDGQKAPLYCAPKTLALTGDNFRQLLDTHIEFFRKTRPTFAIDSAPVELLLLKALQDNFPCNAPK